MIVGISGKKQCGKNTIGNILILIDIYKNSNRHFISLENYVKQYCDSELIPTTARFELKSFAGKLKEITSILCSHYVEDYERESFKKSIDPITGITNREVLQKIGESFRSSLGEDIWIKALMTDYQAKKDNWIVTDVRYQNEADHIKNKGGILIRVNRNTHNNDNHKSEIDLDDYNKFDFIIDNNGSVEELIKKVIEIYDKLF